MGILEGGKGEIKGGLNYSALYDDAGAGKHGEGWGLCGEGGGVFFAGTNSCYTLCAGNTCFHIIEDDRSLVCGEWKEDFSAVTYNMYNVHVL